MRLYFIPAVILAFCATACKTESASPLKMALASEKLEIKRVMDSLEKYEVQIRYTQINRRKDSVTFTDYDFEVNPKDYFYPASTVKFPVAVATLEKLNEIDHLDRHTFFYVEGDSVKTTFTQAVEDIFTVSDNAANNRMIEFLGFDDLNRRITQRGVRPIRICHRLASIDAHEPDTKPLIFYLNDSTTDIFKGPVSAPGTPLKIEGAQKGIGFIQGDSLFHEPFDFSLKNYFPIVAQSDLLKRVIFPKSFPENERFNLNKAQHEFLLKVMARLPSETGRDTKTYYDSYGKFFIFGDSKKAMPEHIKIYNKVGYAYGTLTDCAYIKDTKNKIDFILAATIMVNNNQIFNDDHYEYEEVGIPFLAQLGREIYELELKRVR